MTLKKRRILSLIAMLCIVFAFLLRHIHEQVPLIQVCPVLSSGEYQIFLYWNQQSYSVQGQEETFRDILENASLKHGKETSAMPSLFFEIRVIHEDGNYVITVGADHSVTVARVSDLEGSRTFWKDPSVELFRSLYPVNSETGTGMIPGYRPDGDYSAISFADQPYSEVNSIAIYNGHTGKTSYIDESESIETICKFLGNVRGTNGQSSIGYYDLLHTLVLYRNESAAAAILAEEEPVLTITFGHTYFVYYGEYGDGYPIRYTLDEINCEDVFLFLKPFEEAFS